MNKVIALNNKTYTFYTCKMEISLYTHDYPAPFDIQSLFFVDDSSTSKLI